MIGTTTQLELIAKYLRLLIMTNRRENKRGARHPCLILQRQYGDAIQGPPRITCVNDFARIIWPNFLGSIFPAPRHAKFRRINLIKYAPVQDDNEVNALPSCYMV